MKILFIAPLPPPVTGHSLVSKVLLDELMLDHKVEIVDLSKDSFKEGVDGLKRIMEVAGMIKEVWIKKRNVDTIYLTISESFAGNVKDIFIYLICYNCLPKMYIHLHGGSIKRQLWDRYRILFNINKLFVKKLAGVIISGNSHKNIFDGLISNKQIHIVPNFAQDYLFLEERGIKDKFSNTKPLRILYMSSMRDKKGYNVLADAFLCLDKNVQELIRVDFAGRFDSEFPKKEFLDKIDGVEQLYYHGSVDDSTKKSLFLQSHVFCLPTSYFEGQPISILEAYASGCVVLTTGQNGIRDIFENDVNGFEIPEITPQSISSIIKDKILSSGNLLQMAIENRKMAGEKYRTTSFNSSLRKIIESQHNAKK